MIRSRPNGHDARAYHRWQLGLGALRVLITAGYLAALLASGAAAHLRDLLAAWTAHWWLAVPFAVIILAAGHQLLTFPLGWLGGFTLPRRYELSHERLGHWLRDRAKGGLIGGGLATAGALVVYGLLRVTAWWWLWAAAVFSAGYALLAFVMPVWLVPLFYRLTPLADGDLRSRLLRLAERARVPAVGVWIADQSRRSRTASAAVTGLCRTRRILLFDTLVNCFEPAEVEAVFAHELGHHVAGDAWRGLAVQGGLTLAALWTADRALAAGAGALGLAGPDDLAGLPLLCLVTLAVSLVALPVINGWSRRVETRADDFALRLIGAPGPFIGAMERLAALNLAERDPHFLEEFVLYSHPPVGRRIARAKNGVWSRG
jgi:Zn-dependent protease with chaperone function